MTDALTERPVSIYCHGRRTLAIKRGEGWFCWLCNQPVQVAT